MQSFDLQRQVVGFLIGLGHGGRCCAGPLEKATAPLTAHGSGNQEHTTTHSRTTPNDTEYLWPCHCLPPPSSFQFQTMCLTFFRPSLPEEKKSHFKKKMARQNTWKHRVEFAGWVLRLKQHQMCALISEVRIKK